MDQLKAILPENINWKPFAALPSSVRLAVKTLSLLSFIGGAAVTLGFGSLAGSKPAHHVYELRRREFFSRKGAKAQRKSLRNAAALCAFA
jgi:hypothetical protein